MSEQCDRETTNKVARMLEEELDGDECTGLCMVAREIDHGGPETYEDLIYPLKRIPELALECSQHGVEVPWWYWVRSDTLYRFERTSGSPSDGVGVMTSFKMDVRADQVNITPVILADTPVQEVIDDG